MTMVTLFFIVAAITVTNGAENAYQNLDLPLPEPLMGHITGIYNDALYVFGGRNTTLSTEDNSWKSLFWRLPLTKLTLNGNADIISTLTSNDWELLDVTAPTYGDCTNNHFYCEGQCSVVIGKYLYIVGPYSETTGSVSSTRTDVYRLDLSQDTPVFASDTAFLSDIGYNTNAAKHCVTAVDDSMYILTGGAGAGRSAEGVRYDSNTDTREALSAMPGTQTTPGRTFAGCTGDSSGAVIYLLGGLDAQKATGLTGVDEYSIAFNQWTENSQSEDFDTGNGAYGESRNRHKCFERYTHVVECVGGQGIVNGAYSSMANAIVWNYDDRSEEYVDLTTGVIAMGVSVYEIKNDGSNVASVVLVTGGGTDNYDLTATDLIQYAVRYEAITERPTTTPTPAPTTGTSAPTPSPTKDPLCTGCTHPPTRSPSVVPTLSPVDTQGTDSAARFWPWTILSFVALILSVIYV